MGRAVCRRLAGLHAPSAECFALLLQGPADKDLGGICEAVQPSEPVVYDFDEFEHVASRFFQASPALDTAGTPSRSTYRLAAAARRAS